MYATTSEMRLAINMLRHKKGLQRYSLNRRMTYKDINRAVDTTLQQAIFLDRELNILFEIKSIAQRRIGKYRKYIYL